MNTELVARAIAAIGYALYNKRYSFSLTPAGDQRYTYSLESQSETQIKLRESSGYSIEFIYSDPTRGMIKYNSSEVAELQMSGSSGFARDKYNSHTYSSNFSSSTIQLGELSFQVS